MTIGITGPARWRGAVVALIIAAIVVTICLILLGLMSDLLVDWLWFSGIGYLYGASNEFLKSVEGRSVGCIADQPQELSPTMAQTAMSDESNPVFDRCQVNFHFA
jgi:hypothetical protein